MSSRPDALLCKLRKRLASLYGDRLAHLVLFGSRARNDDESDIDVLVVLRGQVSPCQEIAKTEDLVTALSL